MGYEKRRDFTTQNPAVLTWEICQTMFDRRGYKRYVERKVTDKNNFLDHKCIASYTYIAYDSERICFVVFLKYWSSPRWRKIAEVCTRDKWRIFSDVDPLYSDASLNLSDVTKFHIA